MKRKQNKIFATISHRNQKLKTIGRRTKKNTEKQEDQRSKNDDKNDCLVEREVGRKNHIHKKS